MRNLRLKSVKVTGLQDMFDYEISFAEAGDTVILIAPNGYGKTAFLALLDACLRFQLLDAGEHSFKSLDVVFEDNSRWLFTKINPTAEERADFQHVKASVRWSARRVRRRQALVKVEFFDQKGKALEGKPLTSVENIPTEILARAIDRTLPVSREGFEAFRDFERGDIVRMTEIVERYQYTLFQDDEFKEYLAQYEPGMFQQLEARINCVFIETQRLLFTKRGRPSSEGTKEPEEEILRQAQHLGTLLKGAYANYASTSQSLDRSFPNRLILRSESEGPRETASLRDDLAAIERKRQNFTGAGILDEDEDYVVAPKDEFSPSVADALAIYVEDSKKKLATFDEIYPKVSVFRELISKKLSPKELIINRESGALVRRGKVTVPLDRLSSGEKHEFIMLFRLIFETPVNSVVLIDEPEISLHVAWQLEFMSDLQRIQGANRFQSIIATHSPQIIQGLNDIVFDLADQVK